MAITLTPLEERIKRRREEHLRAVKERMDKLEQKREEEASEEDCEEELTLPMKRCRGMIRTKPTYQVLCDFFVSTLNLETEIGVLRELAKAGPLDQIRELDIGVMEALVLSPLVYDVLGGKKSVESRIKKLIESINPFSKHACKEEEEEFKKNLRNCPLETMMAYAIDNIDGFDEDTGNDMLLVRKLYGFLRRKREEGEKKEEEKKEEEKEEDCLVRVSTL